MNARRGGLGRGLGALIPTGPAEVATPSPSRPLDTFFRPEPATEPADEGAAGSYREIPVDQVHPNPRQPRQVFDEDALAELAHSIREFGLLQPIIVRPRADGDVELVMGERRLRAARAAGLAVVPAIVRQTEDAALLRDAVLENIHRADLNPLEEAAAY
nr:ParB/RepB/Spo0J family partition protein [Geodermatophilaceae bacterium]